MKTIKAVAGIIFNDNNEILCTQRDISKNKYVSYKWEFPGGKVEVGETDTQALKRELMEELEIDVVIEKFFYQVEHDYPDFHLTMPVYLCKIISNNIKTNVHKSFKWEKPSKIMLLDWADADMSIANKIINELV